MESSNDSNGNDIIYDLGHLLRVYRDGRVERLELSPPVPATLDPKVGVVSKDIEIYPDRGVGARLYKPNQLENNKKLPLIVLFHGGAFIVQSAFGALYHNYVNNLAAQTRVLIVSVEYRLAPEHPVPACYDDCWDVLNWVTHHIHVDSHYLLGSSLKAEPWIMEHADFSRIILAGDSAGANIAHQIRIILAGDSAGANIAHQMGLRVGKQGLANGTIKSVTAIILSHPSFWGKDRIGDEVDKLSFLYNPKLVDWAWEVACPGSSGPDDPWMNPTRDPNLGKLGTERVLIFVAQDDVFRDRGWVYKEALEKSGWSGKVEIVESQGENHVFHLYNSSGENAINMMTKVVDFINSC